MIVSPDGAVTLGLFILVLYGSPIFLIAGILYGLYIARKKKKLLLRFSSRIGVPLLAAAMCLFIPAIVYSLFYDKPLTLSEIGSVVTWATAFTGVLGFVGYFGILIGSVIGNLLNQKTKGK